MAYSPDFGRTAPQENDVKGGSANNDRGGVVRRECVMEPNSLFCLKTAMFLKIYSVFRSINIIWFSSKGFPQIIISMLMSVIPIVGFWGIHKRNRPAIVAYAVFCMFMILCLVSSLIGAIVMLFTPDTCTILSKYADVSGPDMKVCQDNIRGVMAMVVSYLVLATIVESYVLAQLKKYYDHIRKIEFIGRNNSDDV